MTDYIIPAFLVCIISFGLIAGTPVYEAFVEGAKDGLSTCVNIFAPVVALMCAMRMMEASGMLELISSGLSPVTGALGIPSDVVPIALMRPVSGSASIALLTDALSRFGADSLSGRMASVIMGATETTFYTTAVYFGATGAKNVRYTLLCALLADAAGILTGCAACLLM